MEREDFITEMDRMLKLVRTEYGLTQDAMAQALGISKKTLVQVEKGRSSLGWTGAVALGAVFSGSQVLSDHWGGDCADMLPALAFADSQPRWPRTMGGRIWWTTVETKRSYRVQQNLVSRHYRILDEENRRFFSTFRLEEAEQRLSERAENPPGTADKE